MLDVLALSKYETSFPAKTEKGVSHLSRIYFPVCLVKPVYRVNAKKRQLEDIYCQKTHLNGVSFKLRHYHYVNKLDPPLENDVYLVNKSICRH